MFGAANQLLGNALASFLPDTWWARFLTAHALIATTILLVIVMLIIFLLALFFDFITDVWKLPFAFAVDAAKYFSIFYPSLVFVAAVTGALIFIFLSDLGGGRWFFAALSVAVALTPFFAPSLAVIAAVVPFNTFLMFLATILD